MVIQKRTVKKNFKNVLNQLEKTFKIDEVDNIDKGKNVGRYRNICFTSYADILEYDKTKIKGLIAQREIGNKCKRGHWQGYVEFVSRHSFKQIKKIFNDNTIHLERRRGTQKQAIDYCQKDDTRLTHIPRIEYGEFKQQGARNDIIEFVNHIEEHGYNKAILAMPEVYVKYHTGFDKYNQLLIEKKQLKKVKEHFKKSPLYGWQNKALKILSKQDTRKILWIYDPVGNCGKSWLGIYLIVFHSAFYTSSGKTNDIAHSYNYQEYIVFDFVRSLKDEINYAIMERLKTGVVPSHKYNSHTKLCFGNKIICLSNFPPDTSKYELSADRWDIREIVKDNNHKGTNHKLVRWIPPKEDE